MNSPNPEPANGEECSWAEVAQSPPLSAPPGVPLPPFEKVYEAHFDFVWRSARRLGVRPGAVEDVVQEVFVIVHCRLATFEGRSTLRTWLYGIVLRVTREHHRRAGRAHAEGAPGGDPSAGDAEHHVLPDERLARAEAVQILEVVLDEMPLERREVFVMVELEQMTIPEIALLLSEKTNTIYSRLRLAREDFERSAARCRARDGWRIR
jgi:RNA polymerase sigma-70 factor (ECF subfamily)